MNKREIIIEMEDIEKNIKDVNKRNKSTIILVILLIITILTATGFAMYAWAKYSSRETGTAEANVARWRFELKDGVLATENQIDFPVTRTDDKFDVVAQGTIAPGTWGEIPITVVTTGTEVHMKYDINITIENCPTNLKFYKDARHKKEFTTTRTGTGQNGDPKTATITIEKYVDKDAHANNGEHEHIIYWYWPFETGKGNQIDANDLIDSEDMQMGTATMAIAATGIEVLELQEDPDYVPETIYALFETSTGTLKLSHNPFENYASDDVYYTGVENVAGATQPKWQHKRSYIKNVEVIDTIAPKTTFCWFNQCSNLINADICNLDTSNVTNMSQMFFNCNQLTSLDVSGFDTSSVTNMGSMFSGCQKLTNIDVSNFNTSSVTSMANMFGECNQLTSLDVSGFDTSSVTNIGYMFSSCQKLTNIDVSNLILAM